MITLAPEPTLPQAQASPSKSATIADLQQTVSASRLNTFLQCRLKFFFRYVAKLAKPKSPALHVGQTVHAVLKVWHKARWRDEPLGPEKLQAAYDSAWSDQHEEPIRWEEGQEAEQKQLGWRLLETYFRERPAASLKPEAVEVPMEADLRRHGLPVLIGIIDLVQAGVITDFKTSASTPNPATAGHVHEVQMGAYAVLYREATGRTEQGIELHHLVKLKTPKLVVTAMSPMTERQQSRLFHLIESYGDGLERRDFVPSPGLACLSCEFFGECRQWR